MGYGEIFELRRQIHELHTDATIMETALRAYEDTIEELNVELSELRSTEMSRHREINSVCNVVP